MSEVKPLSTSLKVLVEKLVRIVLLMTSLVLKHWFPSVIFGTKLLIGQNLVRFADILKHLFRLFLAFTKIFVGMPLESQFTIRLFNLLGICVSLKAKNLVVVLFF
jgi:hypothetical protein